MASDRLQRQIERLLDEADLAITGEDWSTVSSRARSVLAIDPENADGLAYLATADRALGASAPQPPTQSALSTPMAAPTHDPTTFANGRYQVKRFLGEGGKKKVYLAHDTTLDREVAFALIKTDGLDETSRIRIQREAQAMGRLGSHSHIVTVFDLGEEQGQPYMVTELMGGGDVEGVIEAAEDHRPQLGGQRHPSPRVAPSIRAAAWQGGCHESHDWRFANRGGFRGRVSRGKYHGG